MTKITKISDLQIGDLYYLTFGKDALIIKKCKLLGIINEKVKHFDSKMTELYVEFKKSKNLVWCQEIGIGLTRKEAKNNYGKFNYEANENFSDTITNVRVSFCDLKN